MSSLIEHAERVDTARNAEVARLDAILNEEPQCVSGWHDADHRHSGSATHWQIGHCVHTSGLRCASWVTWSLAFQSMSKTTFSCMFCGDRVPADTYRWIEL